MSSPSTEFKKEQSPSVGARPLAQNFAHVSFVVTSIGYYMKVTGRRRSPGSSPQGSIRTGLWCRAWAPELGELGSRVTGPWREGHDRDTCIQGCNRVGRHDRNVCQPTFLLQWATNPYEFSFPLRHLASTERQRLPVSRIPCQTSIDEQKNSILCFSVQN